MRIWQIALISIAAGGALPALAQLAEGPATRAEVEARVRDRLGRFDANHDGIVTGDEMQAYARMRAKHRADEMFAAMDTDKNGQISRAEFDVFYAKAPARLVHIERMDGSSEGSSVAAPPGGPMRRMRMMMLGDDGPIMTSGGDRIVIADAVKNALARFDVADTNKDGRLSDDERRAARDNWRRHRNR